MSNSAKKRDAAYSESDRVAAYILADLGISAPIDSAPVVARLFSLVRARQKADDGMREAQGRLKARDRQVNHLVKVLANLHEQLEHWIGERDRLRLKLASSPLGEAARTLSRAQYLEACGLFHDTVNAPEGALVNP